MKIEEYFLYVLLNFDLNAGLAILVDDLEWEVLHVTLNVSVVKLATDHTFNVEDGPLGVRSVLVLGCSSLSASIGKYTSLLLTCVSDESLIIVPCDIRWCDTVTLVVDQNFNLSALHDTNTRVGGSKIDTDDCREPY